VFLRPPADVVLSPRKSWWQLGSRTTDPFYRRFLPMATALRGYADPQAFFAQYGDTITITHAGDDPGDGVRAVRYDLHADVAKAPVGRPSPRRDRASRTHRAPDRRGLQHLARRGQPPGTHPDPPTHPRRASPVQPGLVLHQVGTARGHRPTKPATGHPAVKTGFDANAAHGQSPRCVSPPKGSGRQCGGLLTEALAWCGDR
jgi:hypothetical protein